MLNQFTTRRILALELLDGVALGRSDALLAERGLDRAELARTLLNCVLREIMVDGVFHADPHPGNILLLADGQLALLDFGSVGHLDTELRSSLQPFCSPSSGEIPGGFGTRCLRPRTSVSAP